jgi:hypothetical protein
MDTEGIKNYIDYVLKQVDEGEGAEELVISRSCYHSTLSILKQDTLSEKLGH